MVNLKDLWIGDEVKIISKGLIGKYEGVGAQKHAFVKIGQKMHLIPSSDLEPYTPVEEEKVDLDLAEEEAEKSKPYVRFEQVIDLHIEKLNPSLVNADPARILDFQVKSAETFLSEATKRKVSSVTIIHGKGTGQLKAEVKHLIGGIDSVRHSIDTNDGGATEVLF